jgi:hypothetical protein
MLSFNAAWMDVNSTTRSAIPTEVMFPLCNATLIQSLAVKIFVPAQPIRRPSRLFLYICGPELMARKIEVPTAPNICQGSPLIYFNLHPFLLFEIPQPNYSTPAAHNANTKLICVSIYYVPSTINT